MEPHALWRKVVQAKYHNKHIGSIPTESKTCNAKAKWKSIVKGLSLFENHYKWDINSGELISFWHSNWHSLNPLSIQFPRLYALYQSKMHQSKMFGTTQTNS